MLDVGAACGYSAAVLAQIVRSVVALEEDAGLAASAEAALTSAAGGHVAVVRGRLAEGVPDQGPYDAIILEGAVAEVPAALFDQLKEGGRLVAVLSTGASSRAAVWRRLGASFDRSLDFDAGAPLLPGFESAPRFVF